MILPVAVVTITTSCQLLDRRIVDLRLQGASCFKKALTTRQSPFCLSEVTSDLHMEEGLICEGERLCGTAS